MSDFMRDRKIVNYELPALRTLRQAELDAALEDPDTRWYALKRLAAFRNLGLVSAASKAWNPLLHPRGPDGKFINKFGWVRTLIDGVWVRGRVTGIAANGDVTVEFPKTKSGTPQIRKFTNYEASKSLWSAPKTKAVLNLPTLDGKSSDWAKTGGQGGSNPGGKFKYVGTRVGGPAINIPDTQTVNDPLINWSDGIEHQGTGALQYAFTAGDLQKSKIVLGFDSATSQWRAYYYDADDGELYELDTGLSIGYSSGVVGESQEFNPDKRLSQETFDALFSQVYILDFQSDEETEIADARAALTPYLQEDSLYTKASIQSPSAGGEGAEFYVKRAKSINHARNEVLANRLYEVAGVTVPAVHLGQDPQYVGSQMISGDVPAGQSGKDTTVQSLSKIVSSAGQGDETAQEILSEIRSSMVVDAWLANWDVVGLSLDNIIIVDNVPVRIDAGGSLLYRAQGGSKGKAFGGQVTELDTLLSGKNPQAAKVFGGITPEELKAGAERVAAISPETIKELVASLNGPDNPASDHVASLLIARRADIIEKLLGGVDPYAAKKGITATTFSDATDDEMLEMYDGLAKTGVLKEVEDGSAAPGVVDVVNGMLKEIDTRNLNEKTAEIDEKISSLKSEGITPEYETVVPVTPDGTELSTADAEKLSEDTSTGTWFYSLSTGTWMRRPEKTQEEKDNERQILANMISEAIDPDKPLELSTFVKPGQPDTVYENKIGQHVLIGGHVFEITGEVRLSSGSGSSAFSLEKRLVLRNIADGQEYAVPYASSVSDRYDGFSWSGGGVSTTRVWELDVSPEMRAFAQSVFEDTFNEDITSAGAGSYLTPKKTGAFNYYKNSSIPGISLERAYWATPNQYQLEQGAVTNPEDVADGLSQVLGDLNLGHTGVDLFDGAVSELVSAKAPAGFKDGDAVLLPEESLSKLKSLSPTGLVERLLAADGEEFDSLVLALEKQVQKLEPGALLTFELGYPQSTVRMTVNDDGTLDYYSHEGTLRTSLSKVEIDPQTFILRSKSEGGPGWKIGDLLSWGSSPEQELLLLDSNETPPKKKTGAEMFVPTAGGPQPMSLKNAGGQGFGADNPESAWKSMYVVSGVSAAAQKALLERQRILQTAKDVKQSAFNAVLSEGTLDAPAESVGDEYVPPASAIALAELRAAELELVRFSPARQGVQGTPIDFETTNTEYIGVAQFGQLQKDQWIVYSTGSDNRPYLVADIKVEYKGDPDKERTIVKLVDRRGGTRSITLVPAGKKDKKSYETFENEYAYVINTPVAGTANPTMKKDGTIVVDGVVVGKWESEYGGQRRAVVDAQYTTTGTELKIYDSATSVRNELQANVVMPSSHSVYVKEKSDKAKSLSTSIKWKVGVLADGTSVERDLPVRSTVDGREGTLIGSIHPSRNDLVYVKYDDTDRLAVVETVSLIATGLPAAKPSEEAPAVDEPAVPSVDELPAAVVTAMAENPKKFVLSDGSAPMLGATVEAGKGAKVVTGTVEVINKDGYMRVRDSDGALHWRSIKVAKTISAPSYAKEPAIALQTSALEDDAMPEVLQQAQPKITDLAKAAGTPILQPQEKIDQAKEMNKPLTIDGYVPEPGLPVIDRQGNKLVIVRVKGAAALVFDPSDPEAKPKSRTLSTLTVDYASYGGTHGKIADMLVAMNPTADYYKEPIKLSDLTNYSALLQGASVYEVEKPAPSGRLQKTVYVVTSSGQVYTFGNKYGKYGNDTVGMLNIGNTEKFFTPKYISGNTRKLGVIDLTDSSGAGLVVEIPVAGGYYSEDSSTPGVVEVLPKDVSLEDIDVLNALADIKKAAIPTIVNDDGEIVEPVTTTLTQQALNNSLPKPADAGTFDPDKDAVGPAIPAVTGEGADLTSVSPALQSSDRVLSVSSAAQAVIDARESSAAGSGVRYALMDEDYIEDALVRFQVVQGTSTSGGAEQFVEARFRLQEERAEEVADTLLSFNTATYGGWNFEDSTSPTLIKAGDYIKVRVSKSTSSLRAVQFGDAPNARVVEPGVLVGKSDKTGNNVYRFNVQLIDGTYASVDVEDAGFETLAYFVWDPAKVISTGSSSKASVSQNAANASWYMNGNVISSAYPSSGIHVDENGVGILPSIAGEVSEPGISRDDGATLYRRLADGSVVRFSAITGSQGGTTQGSGRRSEMARDVRVRVPLLNPDGTPRSQEEIDAALSQGFESVGVPVDKQHAPTEDDLVRWALNKANKHFATQFVHREQLNLPQEIKESDAAATLDLINKRLGLKGEDQLTLDDIEFGVAEDGRVTPKLSAKGAKAVTKRQGHYYYRHSVSGGNPQVIEMLASATTTGLLGADERHSVGIATHGQSTGTDMKNGAGDRVYITSGSYGGGSKVTTSGKIVFSASAVNQLMDGYVNGGDGWGKRKNDNDYITRSGAYEYMIKRKLDAAQIAYVRVDTEDQRKDFIAELKKRGITQIGNRPVEDIVVVGSVDASKDEFQDLGLDAFETVGSVGGMLAPSAGGAGGAGGGTV